MEYTDKLKEVTDTYYKGVKGVAKLKTLEEVDTEERRLVDCLQAVQVLVGNASRDLYAAVQTRREEIKTAATTPVEEVVKKATTKKKATKKSGKNSK